MNNTQSKLLDNRIIVLLIIVAALIAYGSTLQTDVSGSDNPYFIDVGSNQNALNQWGTLHGSAYPLYSFTGAVFTSALRLIGMAPAAASSLYSTVWSIAALITLYLFLVEWRGDRLAALAATALLGFSWAFWLFASYTEVYSLSTFVIVLALWFALKADRTRQTKYLYGVAICCGLTVSHARVIALALPVPLLIALPALWSAFRHKWLFALKWVGLAILTGVVPYVYLLIRSLQHAAWIWGDPSTVEGFWRLMFGSAYTALISTPATFAVWLELIKWVGQIWLDLLTWPVAIFGILGLAWLIKRKHYRYGLAFMIGSVISFIFALLLQSSFPGELMDDIPAMFQSMHIFLLCGLVFLIAEWRTRSIKLHRSSLITAALISGFMIVQNQPVVYALNHISTGRQIISAAQRFVVDAQLPTPPAFFSPWGGEYWSLSFGREVTRDLTNFDLLPNRANLAQALKEYGVIYTFEHTLYNYNLAWWQKHLGNLSKVYLSSAGDNVISIAAQPRLSENDLPAKNQTAISMGASIELRGWTVTPIDAQSWQVTLYWQALTKPDRDYSVFVHASDRDTIDSPEAIIAQADTDAPVYGWYPTTLWSPGEIIRDDHVIAAPADRIPKIMAVGLYYQDETGAFHNLGQQIIPIPPTP
jgi:hypothetical protein